MIRHRVLPMVLGVYASRSAHPGEPVDFYRAQFLQGNRWQYFNDFGSSGLAETEVKKFLKKKEVISK